ncbi:Ribosome association toxin RatA [hydrothermal vent metagenome]|uniref:Ribosome association toxin RatA n=1 Tax=hydrothermal vent metagenome TaxID=652676 RepID=A0A3B1A768_9ZZZZ
MKKVLKHALVPFSASQMYALVNDIESYADFLPWCDKSIILEQTDTDVKASLNIAYGSINKSFTTLNKLTPETKIEMQLVDGPFKKLHGEWLFTQLGDEGCKINFELEFEFKNKLLSMTMGPVFSQIANTLVDSFSERAQKVYT